MSSPAYSLTSIGRGFSVNKNVHKESSAQQLTRKRKLGGNVRNGITSSVNQFDQQLEGFSNCLTAFLYRNGIKCCKDKLLKFLKISFNNIELSQLPKVFKLSLATTFSRMLGQELPKDFSRAVCIIPGIYMRLLRKIKKTKIEVFWDLLQCKDLANKVPDSMIQKAYETHQGILSSVGVSPQPVLEYMKPYFREWAQEVQSCFQNRSRLPPKSAYFSSKRSEGGCLNHFKTSNLITSHIFENRSNAQRRIDPVVFHIFGKPGVGKSHLLTDLSLELSRRFGYKTSDLYERSIATDYWDGYSGQLISAIDDVFSDPDKVADQKQIIQLCSNVDYVLPMAKLEEKGRKFTSDFLFLSSNKPEVNELFRLEGKSVSNNEALLRRVYPAYKLLSRDQGLYRIQTFDYDIDRNKTNPGRIESYSRHQLVSVLCDRLISVHRERRELTHMIIPVASQGPFGTPGIGYKIPLNPSSPLPKVMAHAIPEPLKVRMITKGEEELWVLKPVQMAMWKALKAFPCFQLTGSPDIPIEFLNSWDQKAHILSGDYESATDNLHMDVTALAIDELCKVLPPQYHSWLRWEGGIHEIHYPPSSKLSPILQTRGQLMGSLLSFPILCVANAALISIIKKVESLRDLEALINGDDILFTEHERKIKSWKRLTNSVGLIPSVGKNYQDPNWGSINSQILIRKNGNWTHKLSGCFGCVSKISTFKQNIRQALQVSPENKPFFVIKAKKLLQQTPESIDISTDFGGLGPVNTKEPSLKDKEIYFFKIMNRKIRKIRTIDDYILCEVPKHLYNRYKGILGPKVTLVPDPDLEDEAQDLIFDFKNFKKFQKFYKTVPYLRKRIRNSDLSAEISLHKLSTINIKVPKEYVSILDNLKLHI